MADSTVGALIAGGGKVRWRCDATGHYGDVDLDAVLSAKGEAFDLADTYPPCKSPGCPGVVIFIDGNSMWPRDLTRMKVNSPEWWDHTQGRRVKLEAAGLVVRGGKWCAPASPQ